MFRSVAHRLDRPLSPIVAFHTECRAMKETIPLVEQ